MKMKYKVRFHLAKGDHYMHWQIRAWNNELVQYIDPELYQLELVGCNLVNKIGAARRVNNNGVKDVCGWVECDNYHVHFRDSISTEGMESLSYNPIRDIHWRRSGDDNEFDWDNSEYDCLITDSNRVFICEESRVMAY